MKKKLSKSFIFGVCFFSVLTLLFFTFYLAGFDFLPKKHSQKEYQQQVEIDSTGKGEGRLETIKNDQCETEYYLGIYKDQIAVYEKAPTRDPILKEILPLVVKEVYYQELQKGVPFSSEEEKNLLLENYTS